MSPTLFPSFFGAGVVVGAFLADQMGPMWWRAYWIVVALFLLRAAVILWKRLQLSRMAAGMIVGAVAFASFGFTDTYRGASAALGNHWIWYAALFAVIILLLFWEGRRSPNRLMLLGTYGRSASLLDKLTFRHIPDLSASPDA